VLVDDQGVTAAECLSELVVEDVHRRAAAALADALAGETDVGVEEQQRRLRCSLPQRAEERSTRAVVVAKTVADEVRSFEQADRLDCACAALARAHDGRRQSKACGSRWR
jgi:hypothetical protein